MNREYLQLIIANVTDAAIDVLADALENEKFNWNAVKYERDYIIAERMVREFKSDDEILDVTDLSQSTVGRIRTDFLKS